MKQLKQKPRITSKTAIKSIIAIIAVIVLVISFSFKYEGFWYYIIASFRVACVLYLISIFLDTKEDTEE